MKIRNATPDDAPFIAEAIMAAVGEDIVNHLAGENNNRKDIHDIFTRLAQRDDSQYSYLNTRIAVSDAGIPMGACISYDGEDLIRLRRPFFKEANEILGWGLEIEEIDSLPGETDADEFYLDTLMTLPQFRGKGVASELIRDAAKKARKAGKPLGLLCDTDNFPARKLYNSLGFEYINLRPFAGHDMNHLQKPIPKE